ncbi:MAG: hypothetical protein R8G66_30970 [Cytophagales bacterium]|nr:hypothetical protein [Cytophagales bacterium]
MMLLSRVFAVCLTICCFTAIAQPNTEVYLFDLEKTKGGFSLSNPVNVSDNPGYDNQPSFSSDGITLLYTSFQADEQTDIILYNIAEKKKTRFTETDGSEYSPTESFNGDLISTIILERDGRQLLWSYDLKTAEPNVLVEDLVIGYHCWYDENTLFSFVLGEPATLQKNNLQTAENTVIDEKIGRSLHRIPGKKAISYISKATDEWKVMAYQPKNGKQKVLAETLPNVEDMAWTPEGTMIMGQDSQLYYRSMKDKSWSSLMDLSQFDLTGITRVAISPDGSKLAVVVNE